MTQQPQDPHPRRFGILVLLIAGVFVAAAVVGGTIVTPWLYLVALTAIPNIIAGVRTLLASTGTPEHDLGSPSVGPPAADWLPEEDTRDA